MNRALALLHSSVGQKILMAASGAALIGFLLVHMLGNLYVFQGQDSLNAYAAWLQQSPLLWPARIGLLVIFGLHTYLGISLARANRAARPARYRHALAEPRRTRLSRSMALSGAVVLAFLLFHLLHFTLGAVLPEAHDQVDAAGRHDVYSMVVAGFRNPWITGSYVLAMTLLGLHLAHAGQSFLQTLGIRYEHGNRLVRNAGLALVTVIVLGNIAVPTLVFFGLEGPADLGPAIAATRSTP